MHLVLLNRHENELNNYPHLPDSPASFIRNQLRVAFGAIVSHE
jgi:hypothetical protein